MKGKKRSVHLGFLNFSISSYKKKPKFSPTGKEESFEEQKEILLAKRNSLSPARLSVFYFLLISLALIFLTRLVILQVIEGGKNRQRSEGNRIDFVKIPAPRGVIYDRNGKVLARNKATFRLLKNGQVELIDKDQALSLESQGLAQEAPFEGELGQIAVLQIREYLPSEAFSHLLGFVSEVSEEDLSLAKFSDYKMGDKTGRLGLEEAYEEFLRGKDGKKLLEVNAKGQRLAVLGTDEPEPGKNLNLAIDSELQDKIHQEIGKTLSKIGRRGAAAVAQDPRTGEVLALLSYPTFNNTRFAEGITQEELTLLNQDPQKPFLNRSTQGTYPPGSIFKIVSALAGLSSGKITRDTKIEDTGEIFLGPFRFPNWNFVCCGKTEGTLEITRAIARSNDIFFYRVGERTGERPLAFWAEALGLGKKTEIDLPDEAEGLVPTPEWKKKVKNEAWFPGNTLHMAIGQGDVLTSPLQLSQLTTFIANGGTLYRPYIAKSVTDENGNVLEKFEPKHIQTPKLEKEYIDLVKEGMRQAAAPGGTAWPFHDFKIQCGAKTGTAEAEVENPHAWFTVFCPYDNPQITLTIIIENAGEGSSVSGPVARQVMEWYFTRQEEVVGGE